MTALDEARVPSKGTDWRSLILASGAALSADDVLGRCRHRRGSLAAGESRETRPMTRLAVSASSCHRAGKISKLRLSITMSLDGYVAGPHQNKENPLGTGGLELHAWFFPLKAFREMHGQQGGDVNASSAVVEERLANIGATIMGRNMFGPVRPWMDESWRGWWGENPPFHHPAFVLTHYPREPLKMQGGTTFHVVSDRIESALRQAKDAAQERDISLPGGASLVNQYLAAGLADEIGISIAPLITRQVRRERGPGRRRSR